MSTTTPRRRSIVWPVILIGLGVVLLLQNLGLIAWDFWFLLGRFWPVILIIIGLELILSHSHPWLAAGAVVAIVAAVIGAGIISTFLGFTGTGIAWDWLQPNGTPRTQHEVVPMESPLPTTVDLRFGAGTLTVGSLSAESGSIVEGDFTHSGSGSGFSRSYRCRDNDCTLRLTASDDRRWNFGRRPAESWELSLTPRVPLSVVIQAGASQLDVDLSGLNVSGLQLDAGASRGSIKLPSASGVTRANVKAGAADLEFVIPEGTPARIHAVGALHNIVVDEQRFPRDGDYFVSSDYTGAQNRLDLEVEAAVATVRIR